MRTTLDIPDETYRAARILAAERGETLRQLLLEGLELVRQAKRTPRKKFELPLLPSTRIDKLIIDNETIYDLIDFP